MNSRVGTLSRLRFVKDKDKEAGHLMLEASRMVEESGEAVQWLLTEEISDDNIDKNSIYVLEEFFTPLYKMLNGKTRLIGPVVVIAHMTNNWPLPASHQPIYTMTMHGITICCTQTGNKDKRAHLLKLVHLMGGKTSGNFTHNVTHLVAGQVGSTKYKVACSLNIPILKVSWIEECWTDGSTQLLHALDDEILSVHKCPPLAGCVISSTGFGLEERNSFHKLVSENGGQYDKQLIRDSCTHLLVGNTKSDKYRYAIQWQVTCVTAQWLYKSIQTGYYQDETQFAVNNDDTMKSDTTGVVDDNLANDVTANHGSVIGNGVTTSTPMGPVIEDNDVIKRKRSSEVVSGSIIKRRAIANDDINEEDLLSMYQNAEMPAILNEKSGIFSGKTFSINEVITSQAHSVITKEIKQNGGVIVSHDVSCDYHIAMLSCPPKLPPSAGSLVTMLWLEKCLASDSLLHPTVHFLYKPLPVPISNITLEGCVVTISQFDGLDREHLICLCKSLGAVVQDYFARYPNGSLLASTHLVLYKPQGEKYTSALSWGVPAVTDKWLFACASAQRILPVDDFILSEEVELHDKLPMEDVCDEISDAPFETPLKSFKLDFDINSALRDLPPDTSGLTGSPEGPQINTQLAGMVDDNMEFAMEAVSGMQTDAERRREILKDVVIYIHKKLISHQSELYRLVKSLGGNCRPIYTNECTHVLYQGNKPSTIGRDKQLQLAKTNGCSIVSHHWLIACSNNGCKEDESLYPPNYNPNRSLLMLSQKYTNEMNDQTDNDGGGEENNIDDDNGDGDGDNDGDGDGDGDGDDVSRQNAVVEDVLMCQDGDGISESNIIDDASHEFQRKIRDLIQNTTGLEQMRMEEESAGAAKVATRNDELPPRKETSPRGKIESKQRYNKLRGSPPPLDNYVGESQQLTLTYDDIDGQRERELLDLIRRKDEVVDRNKDDNHNPDSKALSPLKGPSPCNDNCPSTPVNPERKQSCRTRLSSRRKITGNMVNVETPPSLVVPIVTSYSRPLPPSDEITLTESEFCQSGPFKVLLSSLNAQEKADYGALIQELGGVYLDCDHFLPECSHLIIGRSSRTEKYLAACASGKWILNKSYMESCRAENRFVKEDAYEWNSSHQPAGKSGPIDEAPRKWRLKINSNETKGAFDGWKVLLCAESAKQNGLYRLLEAGGANVTTPNQLPTTPISSFTHAFLNPSCLPKIMTVEKLVKNNVLCLRPDYIAEYLQKEIPSDSELFILPEALKIMRDRF